MSVLRPADGWLKVDVKEIADVGAAGAAALALVRYATAIVDERDGRLRIGGAVWWKVSYTDFGKTLGWSRFQAMRVVSKLEEAGKLVGEDAGATEERARLYRIPDQPLCDSAPSLSSDSANSHSGSQVDGAKSHSGRAESHSGRAESHADGAKSHSAPSYREEEKKEEKGEKARARGDGPNVPGPDRLPPPPSLVISEQNPEPVLGEIIDAEVVSDGPEPDFDPEPQRYCNDHMPDGTDASCGACGRRRRIHEAWGHRRTAQVARVAFELSERAAKAAQERAVQGRAQRPRCGMCFDTGIVLTTDGRPVGQHPPRCLHHMQREEIPDDVLERVLDQEGISPAEFAALTDLDRLTKIGRLIADVLDGGTAP